MDKPYFKQIPSVKWLDYFKNYIMIKTLSSLSFFSGWFLEWKLSSTADIFPSD